MAFSFSDYSLPSECFMLSGRMLSGRCSVILEIDWLPSGDITMCLVGLHTSSVDGDQCSEKQRDGSWVDNTESENSCFPSSDILSVCLEGQWSVRDGSWVDHTEPENSCIHFVWLAGRALVSATGTEAEWTMLNPRTVATILWASMRFVLLVQWCIVQWADVKWTVLNSITGASCTSWMEGSQS